MKPTDMATWHDRTFSYQELRREGMSRQDLRANLATGSLRRARRDVYLSGQCPEAVHAAQRVGGRLDCVSALAELGVFVLERRELHVQVEPHRARLRSPRSRSRRLATSDRVIVHWRAGHLPEECHTVSVVPALTQALLCQSPRAGIATLDSALHLGVIDESDLDEIFSALPADRRVLRTLADERAEAGAETIARLLLRGLGRKVEVQVRIRGVGRVDLVVDGWLVVECDSREHHGGWEAQERDRERDLALAARGYVCLRPTARLIFDRPDELLAAVRGLLALRASLSSDTTQELPRPRRSSGR